MSVRPLVIEEHDTWAIGYPGDPLFYFGEEPETMELARKLVAAYNDHAAAHVCKIVQYQPSAEIWECVDCGQHHLVK